MFSVYKHILEKFGFEYQYQEQGRTNFKYWIDKKEGFCHSINIWPNHTWEINHFKLGRVYFAAFESPEAMERFISLRFPELVK